MNYVILIIDDNNTNNAVLQRRLEQAHYEVHVANNAVDGIRLSTKVNPDLILLDLIMPNIDGWKTISELRRKSETKNIPVVAVSSSINDGDAKKLAECGFTAFCIKPIKVKNFIDKIPHWISANEFDVDSIESEEPISI